MTKFVVEKSCVEYACKKALAEIELRRSSLKEKEIRKLMNRRFFPIKTREKAVKRLEDNSEIHTFPPDWKMAGWGTEYDAKRLLEALKVHTRDFIELGKKDAIFVSRYLTEKEFEEGKE